MANSVWKKGRDPDPNRAAVLEIDLAWYWGNLEKFTEIFESNEWYECQVNHFLSMASFRGHANIVRFLLSKGVKIRGAPIGVFNDMFGPKSRDVSLALLEVFMEYGWKPNDPDPQGFMILQYAMGDETLARWLLDHGASPNYGYYPGAMTRWLTTRSDSDKVRSAQEEAARIEQITAELMQNASETEKDQIRRNITGRLSEENLLRFQRKGTDPVAFYFRNKATGRVRQERPPAAPVQNMELDMKKRPPYSNSGDSLNSAAMKGNIALVNLLIERGAMLENSHAIHDAAATDEAKDPEVFLMLDHLLALGLDIDGTDEVRGFYSMGTPLHYAVSSNKIERARFLLEKGADPEKMNWLGRKPLDYLYPKPDNLSDFIKLFEKYCAKTSQKVEETSGSS